MMLEEMPFEPTDQQIQLTAALARFCSGESPADSIFILNGYAGTGKTSVMGALVRSLRKVGRQTVLLASTGRAAKVLSSFTGFPAYTIHRKIYTSSAFAADGIPSNARINRNPHVDTIFIVDEASMIGEGNDGGMNLLQDLVMYVYTGHNCKLILLGDTAQLPPVGSTESPAMNPLTFKEMGLHVSRAVITKTVRQARRSGILYNATQLRRALAGSISSGPSAPTASASASTPSSTASPSTASEAPTLQVPTLTVTPFEDVEVLDPEDLEDSLGQSFAEFGEEQTIMITRSNRRAVDFNRAIRARIFDREELLAVGDRLLVAKNNYYWTSRARSASNPPGYTPGRLPEFLANGEVAIVEKIYATEEYEGVQFADASLFFPDSGATLDLKIILDSLTAETAGLPPEKYAAIGRRVLADASVSTGSVTAQREALKQSPYFNALQVKYAYAVTCHKAQGGQWESVFVDMGYIPPEAYRTPDFYRWLYTSVTRATRRLTLLNPSCLIK